MIIILKPSISEQAPEYLETMTALKALPEIEFEVRQLSGKYHTITEVYLMGRTDHISIDMVENLPAVSRVVRLSNAYKTLGRQNTSEQSINFEYRGVTFSQEHLQLFAGLCAVDNMENVESMFKTLQQHNQVCTRMGAYKPRTSPYAFQGLGPNCFPYVFELAGKYGIQIIAMEVTHQRQIDEIVEGLEACGNPTGVMLQIGTRNAQNFELLKAVGSQNRFPILFKRGFGITLDESLHAAEYLTHAGNDKIIFCLRGVKSHLGAPHRNLVDFAHVPVIKRLTRMPVCIDPSHSVGLSAHTPDGINELFHATAQGVISGANMILVDFHPCPAHALVDSRQAVSLNHLGWYLDDIALVRETYEKRKSLAQMRPQGD